MLERGAEALIDAVIDTAQCLVCVLDPEGRIVRFNELCERATGYAADEVVGHDVCDLFIPPEHREAFAELLDEVWTTLLPSPQLGEWMTRDGGRFPVAWSNRPLTDDAGAPLYLVTAGIDLSGRDVLHAQLEAQLALAVRLVEEQAALRRVATIVATSAKPEAVFTAVSAESAALLSAEGSAVFRFDGDEATVVGRFAEPRVTAFPVGWAVPLTVDSAVSRLRASGAPARIDAYDELDSPVATRLSAIGFTSSVAAPIHLHNRLWGAVVVVKSGELPEQAESRLAEFAGLVAVALADAEGRERLLQSRARIVRASDDERRRLERNLHDGAQQRLVSLSILLRLAKAKLAPEDEVRALVEQACSEVEHAIDDLRRLAQGLHPPLLAQRGVAAALRAVAKRVPLAVEIDVPAERFPEEIEAAIYYVAVEALTNAVKHAEAESAVVSVEVADGDVRLRVSDDGHGGAREEAGSGLRGLRDRVDALRGTFKLLSPPGEGTLVEARLRLDVNAGPAAARDELGT